MAVTRRPYIGQMDRKIKLFRVVVTKDKVGQEQTEIELYCESWSKLENDYGSETIDMAVMNNITRVYVVRWRREIEKDGLKMLVEDSGVKYNIISVSPLGRKSHLVIKCSNEQ